MDVDHLERCRRARLSLEGLSLGDAFGECFFAGSSVVQRLIAERVVAPGPWPFTDDTQMALSVLETLRLHGEIRQDELAQSLAFHYDGSRGYGPAMHRLLGWIRTEIPWQVVSRKLFDGQGSWGNGAAMRVSPVGAYFAEDPGRAAEQALLSAEVTHAHPEGGAGAAAVAVATALAWQRRGKPAPSRPELIDAVLPYVPDSQVRAKLKLARDLAPDCSVRLAVEALGNGSQLTAQDTVPFVLWCAGERLASYEEALWLTVSGLGDRDTTCAMVGGIVVMYGGEAGIPESWRAGREPLPGWPFESKPAAEEA